MTAPQPRRRLWVDTDIGDNPDDAVALVVAARHPRVEVAGASITGGDHDRRAAVATDLLAALGVPAPVTADLGALPPVDGLLAIGPLTNLAAAFRAGTALPRAVVAMGGALGEVRHRGRTSRVEHNFATDPAAAAVVVRECPDLVLVPLDVTARLTLDDAETRRLAAAAPALAPSIAQWQAAVGQPLCLHDPFALLVLAGDTDDLGASTRHVALRVDDDGSLREQRDGVAVTVVVDVDERRAVDHILQVVGTTTEGD